LAAFAPLSLVLDLWGEVVMSEKSICFDLQGIADMAVRGR
jgi:hypothetical protein